MSDAKYTVKTGYYGDTDTDFEAFPEALEFYAQNPDAQLFGQGVDFDCDEGGFFLVSDGLTDAERDAVEAVERPNS